jgi:hypothetical protein
MEKQVQNALERLQAMMSHLDRNNKRFWRDVSILRQRVIDLEEVLKFYRAGRSEVDMLQY